MYVGPHVMYHCSYQIATKLEFSQQILEKNTYIKFQEKPPIRSRDGQTETTRLIIPFRNLANAPKSRNKKVIDVIFTIAGCFIFVFTVNTTTIQASVDMGEEFLSATA
jgi:hypothetical protein